MMRALLRTAAVAAACLLISQQAIAQTEATAPNCTTPGFTPPRAANSHSATSDDYPLLSKILNEQGDTILDLIIKDDGSVGSAKVFRSSGSLRLDDASVSMALQRWRYTPALSADGKPVACRWRVEVKWIVDYNTPTFSKDFPANVIQMKLEDYPADARARGEQGFVALVVLQSEDGKTRDVIVFHSSGFTDLDAASVKIVTDRLHAANAQYEGKPVRVMVALIVVWSLSPAAMPPDSPKNTGDVTKTDALKPK